MQIRGAFSYLSALATAVAVPAAFLPVHALVQDRPGTVALAQIIAVVIIASYWGTKPAVVASLAGVLAWDYWFLPPFFTFKLEHLSRNEDALLVAFLIASILVGQFSSHVRSRAVEADRARQETERQYAKLKREIEESHEAHAALLVLLNSILVNSQTRGHETALNPASLRGRRTNGYDGPRKKVLIVDDVDTNRAMLVLYLRMLGFATFEATHGQEALDRIEAMPVDLVLMDMTMPVMDGLEATRRLRSSPHTARLPIIVVSARAFDSDVQACMEAGADAVVVKPVDLGRLRELIGELLGLTWKENSNGHGPAPPAPA